MAQKHNTEYNEKPMTRDGRIQGPSRRYRRLRHPSFPAAEWTAKNPLLQRGEIGIEIDTHMAKLGDGHTYWNDLPYALISEYQWGDIGGDINNQTDLVELVDDAVAAETNRAVQAESVLQNNIDAVAANLSTEITNRTNADTALQNQITTNKNTMDSHIADTSNPHNVTKAQVGLGNVNNTSDADKPISTATQVALDGKQNVSDANYQMGNSSGGWTTMTTQQQNALNSGATVTKINQIATNTQTIADEITRATSAESALSDRITANTNNFANYRTASAQDAIDATLATKTELGNETTARENADSTLQGNITAEATARENADNGLQAQIDAIVSKSDVVDIVGTYAELQAYDTSSLGNNDVVKVISDSTHNNAPSYYRWVITGGVGAWVYIGSESETYTKAETDALLNQKQNNLTTAQQAAVDSGITAQKRTNYDNHLANTSNPHQVTKAQVGLGNVNNTSDADKPISTATQTALNAKQDTISDLATIRTGAALGATAVQPADLATVATTGSYNDLSDKPTIPAAQVNSDWNANSGVAQILNKPTLGTAAAANATDFATASQGALASTAVQPGDLATVATTGSYNDLSDKPTIPADISAHRINGAPLSNSASVFYGTSSTAAATVEKVVSIPSITTLDVGTVIVVQPTATSTVANSTIKLNNFSAYPMRYNNAAITTSTDSIVWNAAYPSVWAFDGTYWRFVAHGIDSNTTYSTMSVTEGTTGTETSNRVLQAVNLKQIIQGTTLTGIDVATTGAVSASDTITDGIGKLQATKADKSELPTVNNATLTIQRNGAVVQTFTANQATNATANIAVPTATSQITNDSGFITSSALAPYALSADLATVATTGDYDDLSNKPTIPTVGNGTITFTQGGVVKGSITTNQIEDAIIPLDAGSGDVYTKAETDTLLSNKVDKGHQVIDFQAPTSANGYTWYRKYADGWVEQGGIQNGNGYYARTTVTLPIAMADNTYQAFGNIGWPNESGWYTGTFGTTANQVTDVTGATTNKTTTSFMIQSFSKHNWYVCGMAA